MSLGLLGAYLSDSENDTSSNSESEDENCDKEKSKAIGNENKEVLVNPFLSGGSSNAGSSTWLPKPSFMQESEKVSGLKFDNSVFSNPFRAKEDKKDAILEQHVEMTLNQKAGRTIDGKKVCWNFRKGRCRHGHKCNFAHDSDVKNSVVEALYTPKYDSGAQVSCLKSNTKTIQPLVMESNMPADEFDEVAPVKKKRPGLSDSLAPSKKAMKFHNKVYN